MPKKGAQLSITDVLTYCNCRKASLLQCLKIIENIQRCERTLESNKIIDFYYPPSIPSPPIMLYTTIIIILNNNLPPPYLFIAQLLFKYYIPMLYNTFIMIMLLC